MITRTSKKNVFDSNGGARLLPASVAEEILAQEPSGPVCYGRTQEEAMDKLKGLKKTRAKPASAKAASAKAASAKAASAKAASAKTASAKEPDKAKA